jgi:hypothetical protein
MLMNFSTSAQNLIADPGFEIHDPECDSWLKLVHWYNPNTATPDLTCLPAGQCNQILTPEFIESFQYPLPYDGDCMMGMFWCYSEISSFQTREYIATKLISPLEAGTEYVLSFFVSRSIRWNLAIDKVGAFFFSVDSTIVDYSTIMQVEPQVETSGEVLTPDLEWQLITLTYTATGGEQHMVLGNFRDYHEMTVVNTGTSWKNWDNAYYFVDEVTLQPQVSTSVEDHFVVLLEGRVYSNELYLSSNVHANFRVFDVLGRPVMHGQLLPGNRIESLENLTAGMYVLTIQSGAEVYTRKFWKE